ncbi:unnamed protein product [Protopolystoma xenopodis]|uniref:Uncharacterized protein n=1 Tax=Protopolystoma xenopodis TaxID=117903 RepID=A0A448XGN2_9PLAT|nr:unnamed protein product [Protopolystoma xenopodis]
MATVPVREKETFANGYQRLQTKAEDDQPRDSTVEGVGRAGVGEEVLYRPVSGQREETCRLVGVTRVGTGSEAVRRHVLQSETGSSCRRLSGLEFTTFLPGNWSLWTQFSSRL